MRSAQVLVNILVILLKGCCCELCVTPEFVTSGGEDFNLGVRDEALLLGAFCVAKFY